MKINLGQIATGAMTQYLKDDDARIATAEKRREARKKFERDKELLKVEYDFRDRNARKKEGYEARNSTVDLGDQSFHYPDIDPKWWPVLKKYKFEKLWQDKDIAKRTGVNQVPMAKLNWINSSARKLMSNPQILREHPELSSAFFNAAQLAAASGDVASLSKNEKGEYIQERTTLANMTDLQKLANYSIENDDKSRSSAESLVNYFYRPPPAIRVENPAPAKMFADRAKQTNLWSDKRREHHIPLELYNKMGTALVDNGIAHSLNPRHYDLGRRSMNTREYDESVKNFVHSVQTSDEVSESIKSGALQNGRRPSIEVANAASSSVMFLSDYNYIGSAKVLGGKTIAPVVPEAATKQAQAALSALPDYISLTGDLDRMLQINEYIAERSTPDKGFVENLMDITAIKTVRVALESAFRAVKPNIERETQIKIDRGLSLKEVYTPEAIKELGITGTYTSEDGNTYNLSKQISNAVEAANKRISAIDGSTEAGAELIKAETEYAHLKIRTIFGIAKVIQGGTGGRGVSNLDFEFVAKSLAQGGLSTLERERAAFKSIRDRTVKQYIRNRVISNARIHETSKRTAITNKSYNVFRTLENMHRSRKELALQDELDAGAPERDKRTEPTESEKIERARRLYGGG